MVRSGGAVVVGLVARVARGALAPVHSVTVAGAAGLRRVRSCEREVGLRVIEHRTGPSTDCMAGDAVGREPGAAMVRSGGAVVVGLVARVARGALAAVHRVGVATVAVQRLVRPGQCERRAGVIKATTAPRRCAVAVLTRRRESRRRVLRIGRRIERILVTRHAQGALAAVDAVTVAGSAGLRRVRTGERKVRLRVIERRAGPSAGGVTGDAVGRKPGAAVVRSGGAVVVGLVTRVAGRALALVHPIAVASGARDGGMRTGQRKSRRLMIERGRLPARRLVAALAGGRISQRCMTRVGRGVVGGAMTADARRR